MKKPELEEKVKQELLEMQDLVYRDFQSKLMPTVAKEKIIGIRIPILRAYGKTLYKEYGCEYLELLPHEYYEENNLHGMLITELKDYDEAIKRINEFLPYIDNWATCDLLAPKIFKKRQVELEQQVKVWLESEATYTIRFGVVTLIYFYCDEKFDEKFLEWVSKIDTQEYYVKMAIAWFFATALTKQWDSTINYIEEQRLEKWVHNKSIQKGRESLKISSERKLYLKSLKIDKK